MEVVLVLACTQMGHQARHEASERRRAAFVDWVDSHGGRDMLLELKAHRHTLEEVALLAGAPINVVLTVGMERYGVRMSRARDLGEPRVKAKQERQRKAPAPPSTRLAEVRETRRRTSDRPQLPPFFVQALLDGARRYPGLTPAQVTRGTIRVLRSEAARPQDHHCGYER